MARGANAVLAVNAYDALHKQNKWQPNDAWKGIALLLLTCKTWKLNRWKAFHNVVVYREANDFKVLRSGPNSHIRNGARLTTFLETELGLTSGSCCDNIGTYWRLPAVKGLQPNNLVGHAFRSIVARILELHGDNAITFEEEVDPKLLFPGQSFQTRSKGPRIDIVAFRNGEPAALISVRWRIRHDRVDVVDEALAYKAAARRNHPNCRFYAVLGEFSGARLDKVLQHCAPAHANPSIDGTVHFNPAAVTNPNSLHENGRTVHLKSLDWLIQESFNWRK